MATNTMTDHGLPAAREQTDLLVAVDVGSARIACAIAEVGGGTPEILAVETTSSYGIRGGEIIDMNRAAESIRIAIEAAADRTEADVKTVVVGLSGDVKLTTARAGMDLDKERRTVSAGDISRLRKCVTAEVSANRRVVHRFDGPFSVGDLNGVEHPEGLNGDRLEMQASFLSASADRLDNVLRAVRATGVDIEAVSLEPMSCSLGALSPDERVLGAAVLDFGAGAFRAALWEGGRLRQILIAAGDNAQQSQSNRAIAGTAAPAAGMDGVVFSLARRFRIAPATAQRLIKTHGALGEEFLADLPGSVEVAAVDGLGSVKVETRELSSTIEELLTPIVRSLREGLTGFSPAHSVGVVVCGGGAQIRGLPEWISKRFSGAPGRAGAPRWRIASGASVPPEIAASSGCSLYGLITLGAEGRARMKAKRGNTVLTRLTDRLRRITASL